MAKKEESMEMLVHEAEESEEKREEGATTGRHDVPVGGQRAPGVPARGRSGGLRGAGQGGGGEDREGFAASMCDRRWACDHSRGPKLVSPVRRTSACQPRYTSFLSVLVT